MSIRFLLATLLLSLLPWHVTDAAQKRQYVMFGEDGVKSGEQVVTVSEKGQVNVTFEYKDNGRGPELIETILLNSDGTLSNYTGNGKSTFGSPIDEHFQIKGDVASWRAGVKQGSTSFTGSPMYLPVDGSFEVLSLAIAAMAKRNSDSLPLLPSGTLKKSVVKQLTLEKEGKSINVDLVMITGIGLSPDLVWVTQGEEPSLFASIDPGSFYFIDQYWQDKANTLAEIQKGENTALLEKWASDLPSPLPGLTQIKNARIFDSQTQQLSTAKDIFVLRGKITHVADAGSLKVTADNVIDVNNRIILPGLIDMHSHVSRWEGPLHLAAGVTTTRDLGNDNANLQMMMDEIADNKLLAPFIVPTGFLEGESPFSARNGFVIDNLQEAKEAIDWYAAHGYIQLKIYNSFPKAILKETVDYAHSRGLRVSGHVPAFLKAEDAIAAGYDEIQHINQIVLNFLVKPDTDTRTLDRFYLPAREFADFDLNGPQMKAFIQLLKDNKVTVDPTLATFDFLKRIDGVAGDPFKAIVDHLPPDVQRRYHTAEIDIPDEATARLYERSFNKMVELVGIFYRAGIPIVAGTDELAGFTLQGELELLVKAGLTPTEALQVATRDAANISGLGARKGQVKPGFDADLLILDGDPTQNISDIRNLVLVITQGKALYPSTLYKAMGIKPFTQNAPSIERQTVVESGTAAHGSGKHFH